ncbi:tripartite tricarboxylate transporter substrate binding protein [Caenimonas sp. DR4.4]|uniref:Tripartite tricarboxylate transporter substrate binding protein n=2 Tax=Caenimonas aquaedulcis TaxID=2793270 RepID=A0A931MJN5_9BURK|nr:tripartite tricarboxylate transporter substrate binding protein [Caenimonas aquaedulcis]
MIVLSMSLRVLITFLLAAAATWVAPVHAETFPGKAVRIIVPFPPGGTQDLLARTLAEGLGQRLKQPVIVENRAGAAGNVGAEALARATPDGYTLGILSGVQSANAAFYRKLNYNLERDFVPVRAIGESGVLLVAAPHAPFRNVEELLAYAKANPGRANFGSTTSLTIDLLRSMTGADITMVTYKGIGEALQDAIGGRIEMVAGPAPQLIPLIRDGKVRALGIASTSRLKDLPGVKTVAESVPGYDAGMWYGVFAPAATPREVVQKLQGELGMVVKQADVVRRFNDIGVQASGPGATADLPTRMQVESARWRAVAARTGNYAN